MLFGKSNSKDKYKFIDLKVYAWDRAYADKKKYRRVYDRAELTYLSVELSFYNKLFDEGSWSCDVKLVASKIRDDQLENICEESKTLDISQELNTVYHYYGYGNDERGSFWEEGKYQWEAFIDGELVGSVTFYIEDRGLVTPENNPYILADFFSTYEAPEGDVEKEHRTYLKAFNVDTTRYIMGELRFINHVPEEWFCELFFNIYDDTAMLIGSANSFSLITPGRGEGEEFSTSAGWGSPNPGTWLEDNYTMEVIFMDCVIAVIPFKIGAEEVARISDYEAMLNEDVGRIFHDAIEIKKSNADLKHSISEKPEEKSDPVEKDPEVEILIDDRPVEEILAELDGLIGLQNIKEKVREYIDYISFLHFRKESGIEETEEVVLHSVFTGNPGTGKTTVVKLLGKIFKSMGLLSKGHVHTVEANDLISGFVRQSGSDTKKVIEEARGGILFVDEAYMLYKKGASNDFGPEAVAALITEMSDGKGDLAIMVAGYPDEMADFLDSNPGLKSRFRNYFHFEDYTPEELMRIADYAARIKGLKISKQASVKLKEIVVDAFRKRSRSFGNARFVHALIDEAKINLGRRVMKNPNLENLTKSQLSTLREEDIEDIRVASSGKKLSLDIDDKLLQEALQDLTQLTGLENIKQEVQELVKLTRYYKETGRDILKAFSMHSVFMGNPGTGKTTVARILSRVYKALGMLERGHLVEADGSDLIAGFVGQSALKTKELVNKAQGGILFIDEAYSLTDGRNSDFGKKAVAALLKEMEDRRSEFGVIVAGYTGNMNQFLKSNPGLTSRFDQTFLFKDFTLPQLWEIAKGMFGEKGLTVNKEATEHLKVFIESLFLRRDRFFGNARSMRKMVEKAVRNHELRMADLEPKSRTEKAMTTVSLEDVKEFEATDNLKPTEIQPLGFRIGKGAQAKP